jgi:hypothetical protein
MVAAAALLAACNPVTLPDNGYGYGVVVYVGPSGGWVEVSIAGLGGVEAEYWQVVATLDSDPRLCRDAGTGAIESCSGGGGGFLGTDQYVVTTTAFRPTYSPVHDDVVTTYFRCRLSGAEVPCPGSIRVTLRAVDTNGRLIGDFARTW